MDRYGTLYVGLMFVIFGGFMAFAPKQAERLHQQYPFIRTGGPLRALFGWTFFIIGTLATVVGLYNAL